ncbi:SHOCT domain-containing protein [Streptomyces sp. NPDC046831]|uniref:SHOCT domain-containing protein n=1 Tax=Streptomyces sp. NPDC046831 TaxID=3154805 RepID=UPI0033C04392
MMYWYPYGPNGLGWLAMALGMVLLWALLIGAGVLVFRSLNRGSGQAPDSAGRPGPEQLLAERFARGEIDEDEFRRRLSVLRQDGTGHAGQAP